MLNNFIWVFENGSFEIMSRKAETNELKTVERGFRKELFEEVKKEMLEEFKTKGIIKKSRLSETLSI